MPKGVEHLRLAELAAGISIVNQSTMPKGVEHQATAMVEDEDLGVNQSTMPKGVEHPGMRAQGRITASGEPIYDAERR